MCIQSNDLIVGQPALAIRKLLKQFDGTIDTIAEVLHVDDKTAREVFHAGYLWKLSQR